MQARMNNPVMVLPEAMKALMGLAKTIQHPGVPPVTHHMVHLRASQINGCSFCVDMHSREMKHAGESEQRIWSVAAWREAPWFTDAERAALDLTEAVTRIADRGDAVPDEVWNEARRHYDEGAISALLISISMINLWNRLNVSVRSVVGGWSEPAKTVAA